MSLTYRASYLPYGNHVRGAVPEVLARQYFKHISSGADGWGELTETFRRMPFAPPVTLGTAHASGSFYPDSAVNGPWVHVSIPDWWDRISGSGTATIDQLDFWMWAIAIDDWFRANGWGIPVRLSKQPWPSHVSYTHNEGGAPRSTPSASGVGWHFTPAADIVVNRIQTRFRSLPYDPLALTRDITVEIRAGVNGIVLRDATFMSAADSSVWVGGGFADFLLRAGTTYFIDFLNVGDIEGRFFGLNAIGAPPSGEFSSFGTTAPEQGSTEFSVTDEPFDPIIQFGGPATSALPVYEIPE